LRFEPLEDRQLLTASVGTLLVSNTVGVGGYIQADPVVWGNNAYGDDVPVAGSDPGNFAQVQGSGAAPQDMAINPCDGNLYVNAGSGCVQAFDGTSGNFLGTFVAANGDYGFDIGGLAFGPDGNLYVGYYSGEGAGASIIKFDGRTGAYLRTFVAAGATSLLQDPEGLVFGPNGDLYVADASSNRILRFEGPNGNAPGQFINSASVVGYGERLTGGIVFGGDWDNLFVSCYVGANGKIEEFDANLNWEASISTSNVAMPHGLTFSEQTVNSIAYYYLYVADYEHDRVACYQYNPGDQAADDAILYLGYVVPANTNGLDGPTSLVFAPEQEFASLSLNSGSGEGIFGGTTVISATLDTGRGAPIANQTLEFSLGDNHWTAYTNANGVASVSGISLAGYDAGVYPAEITVSYAGTPQWIACSTSSSLVVNQATPTVTVTAPGGTYNAQPFAATASVAGVGGTPAASLEEVSPTLTYYVGTTASGAGASLAPTAVGTYTVVASFAGSDDYTAASSAPLTFTIAPAAIAPITTVAGNGTEGSSGNGGPAIDAELNAPHGLAVDTAGNVYFADTDNDVIRVVNGQSGVIRIVAGTNSAAGYAGDGGQAVNAELHAPTSVAVDNAGNLFIADTGNNVIREVNYATGVITTVAGNGTQGYGGDGAQATAARLDAPTSVAVDAAGNLYIADSGNSRVRMVNHATGVITTVAGTGTAGYSGDGAQATAAQLANPAGVALDGSGNLFIADSAEQRIRAVNLATGVITTVAGNGTQGYSGDGALATAAELSNPYGVAVDSSGNLYIADRNNSRLREVDAHSGLIITVAGSGTQGYSGDGGPATAAELFNPSAVAVDSLGDVYLSDTGNNRIRQLAVATRPATTLAFNAGSGTGTFGDSTTLAATLSASGTGVAGATIVFTLNGAAAGTAVTDSNGVATLAGVRITGLNTVATFAGDVDYLGSTASATLSAGRATPTVTVTDMGGIYDGAPFAAEALVAGVVTGVDATPAASLEGVSPTLTYFVGSTASGEGSSEAPVDVGTYTVVAQFAGSADYLAASSAPLVFTISAADSGVINTIVGDGSMGYSGDGGPAADAELYNAQDLVVDSAGNIYIADTLNNAVRMVSHATGLITTIAGNGFAGYGGDGGPATAAQLNYPTAVALDGAGNLLIADYSNCRVRAMNLATGVITTVAGNGHSNYGSSGSNGDGGPALDAVVIAPNGLVVDGGGDLYIAEGDNRIRKVNHATGVITTIVGTGAGGFRGDGGQAVNAQIDCPAGLALDAAGNLYLCDTGNGRIRRVNLTTGVITTVAGNGSGHYSGDGGLAIDAGLESPQDVALDDAGNLFIADTYDSVIRVVNLGTGVITAVAGIGFMDYGGDGGPATQAGLSVPYGVTLDNAGNILIADTYNQRIRRVGALPTAAASPATCAMYDPATATFYLHTRNAAGYAELAFGYGSTEWIPLSGDWDGNGITGVGAYDASTSTFYLAQDLPSGIAQYTFGFGAPDAGWIPLSGDWDGDGRYGVGLYDPTGSVFYLTDALTTGMAQYTFGFGQAGLPVDDRWLPIAGDWNGSGHSGVGLYDPLNSTFYLTSSLVSGTAEYAFGFGPANLPVADRWKPIAGDWTGRSMCSVGLYDPSGSQFYLTTSLTTGMANITFGFGAPGAGWLPLAGTWSVAHEQAPGVVTSWAGTAAARLHAARLAGAGRAETIGNPLGLERRTAGQGGFVDPAPSEEEEFVARGTGAWQQALDPLAVDQIDLSTLVDLELGHLSGLVDDLASLA
jgi:sugar lactone lactonase YvrE